jgi:hypothetical protein
MEGEEETSLSVRGGRMEGEEETSLSVRGGGGGEIREERQ